MEVEFLRYLSDFIDQKIDAKLQNNSESEQINTTDDENPMDRDDVFVPPLQAKIEMMKKLSGVPLKDETLSQSQEQGGPAQRTDPSQADELKKQLTMSEMFDDGPMDE